jgi:hypothetical protein
MIVMLQLRGLGGLGIAGVLMFILAASPLARAAEIFNVADIRVDESADNEVSAKSAGMAKAQRIALRAVLERLTQRIDHARLPAIEDEIAARALRDFSVSEEKFGGGRYLARLSVRFKPDEIRSLLRNENIPYAEVASSNAVVLPVYRKAGAVRLWDEPNPWFAAWSRRPPPSGLVPIVVPLRELSDVSTINARQALAGDSPRLRAIASKYNAGGALVAVARLRRDPSSGDSLLDVAIERHMPGEPSRSKSRSFSARKGTKVIAFFDWVVGEVVADLEEDWKRENLQHSGPEQRIRVYVPLRRLGDWLAVRRVISRIPSVKQLELARLSVREAEIDLTLTGQPEQLKRSLARKKLDLAYVADRGGWVVRRRAR